MPDDRPENTPTGDGGEIHDHVEEPEPTAAEPEDPDDATRRALHDLEVANDFRPPRRGDPDY